MLSRDPRHPELAPVPFADLAWPFDHLRGLDEALTRLEFTLDRCAVGHSFVCRGPKGDVIRIAGDSTNCILRREIDEISSSASALDDEGGELRVRRVPGRWLESRDLAYLREAGIEPRRNGVCLPEGRRASRDWVDLAAEDLARLTDACQCGIRHLHSERERRAS